MLPKATVLHHMAEHTLEEKSIPDFFFLLVLSKLLDVVVESARRTQTMRQQVKNN